MSSGCERDNQLRWSQCGPSLRLYSPFLALLPAFCAFLAARLRSASSSGAVTMQRRVLGSNPRHGGTDGTYIASTPASPDCRTP
jgi:hypothetical protein